MKLTELIRIIASVRWKSIVRSTMFTSNWDPWGHSWIWVFRESVHTLVLAEEISHSKGQPQFELYFCRGKNNGLELKIVLHKNRARNRITKNVEYVSSTLTFDWKSIRECDTRLTNNKNTHQIEEFFLWMWNANSDINIQCVEAETS